VLRANASRAPDDPEDLGKRVAAELLRQGARELLNDAGLE
jgi:hypothetical protein